MPMPRVLGLWRASRATSIGDSFADLERNGFRAGHPRCTSLVKGRTPQLPMCARGIVPRLYLPPGLPPLISSFAWLRGSSGTHSPGPYRSPRELSLAGLVGSVTTAPTYVVGSRDRHFQ